MLITLCKLQKLQVLTEEQKTEHEQHLNVKVFTRHLKVEKKEEANNSDTVVTAAFGLQQVFCHPTDQLVQFIMLVDSKVTILVTEVDYMNTSVYLLIEDEAEKGSCEISTAIFEFLEEKRMAKKI